MRRRGWRRSLLCVVLLVFVTIILILNSTEVSAAGRRYGGRAPAGKGAGTGAKAGRYYRRQQQQQQQQQEPSDEEDTRTNAATDKNEGIHAEGHPSTQPEDAIKKSEPKLCMMSSGFLAPTSSGPLGLRVKRDTDLPTERGLFVVIAIEPGSPSASTLHVGDTITMINGQPTKDMTVAAFSQVINNARNEGTGLVSMTFYTKHCPPPPVETPPSEAQLEQEAQLKEEGKETGDESGEEQTDKELPNTEAPVPRQETSITPDDEYEEVAESIPKKQTAPTVDPRRSASPSSSTEQVEQTTDETESDAQEANKSDEANHEEDAGDQQSEIYGEYLVALEDFQPPLGLRVSQDEDQLVVLGVMAKPELWDMVKIGDVLHSIQGEEPHSTQELKDIVAKQQGQKRVTVRFMRALPRARNDESPQIPSDSGPRIQFTLKHRRSSPLGLRFAPLPQTGTAQDGYLAVVEVKGPLNEYVQVGDRLRLVGNTLVRNGLEVSEALKGESGTPRSAPGTQSAKVELVFIRGVQGTLNDMGKGSEGHADEIARARRTGAGLGEQRREHLHNEDSKVTDRKEQNLPEAGPAMTSRTKVEPAIPAGNADHEEEADAYDDENDDEDTVETTVKDSTVYGTSGETIEARTTSKSKANKETKQETPSLEQVGGSTETRDTPSAEEEEEFAALERMRQEALSRMKEADEIKLKADAALKELERKREEQEQERKRRAQKLEEERKRKERELQEKREKLERELRELEEAQQKETCVDPSQLDADLEERLVRVLSDPNTVRVIAKELATRMRAEKESELASSQKKKAKPR